MCVLVAPAPVRVFIRNSVGLALNVENGKFPENKIAQLRYVLVLPCANWNSHQKSVPSSSSSSSWNACLSLPLLPCLSSSCAATAPDPPTPGTTKVADSANDAKAKNKRRSRILIFKWCLISWVFLSRRLFSCGQLIVTARAIHGLARGSTRSPRHRNWSWMMLQTPRFPSFVHIDTYFGRRNCRSLLMRIFLLKENRMDDKKIFLFQQCIYYPSCNYQLSLEETWNSPWQPKNEFCSQASLPKHFCPFCALENLPYLKKYDVRSWRTHQRISRKKSSFSVLRKCTSQNIFLLQKNGNAILFSEELACTFVFLSSVSPPPLWREGRRGEKGLKLYINMGEKDGKGRGGGIWDSLLLG